MTQHYRLDPEGNWIDKATGLPMETIERVCLPRITRDVPSYISPVTRKPVDGRAAQREDLKRAGCRVADPSEFKVTYESKERAIQNGGEWAPRVETDVEKGYRAWAAERAKAKPVASPSNR